MTIDHQSTGSASPAERAGERGGPTSGPEALVGDPASLVGAMGGHPLGQLAPKGLEADDAALFRWLLVSLLISGRASARNALGALGGLEADGRALPAALAGLEPTSLAQALAGAGIPHPERLAPRLVRVARGLLGAGGSISALGRDALDLESLAGTLAALGPGLGAATLARFLAPLRERFPAAADLPVEPAATVAAIHLGWLPEGCEGDAAFEPLRRRAAAAAVDVVDLEWALGQLGRRACMRNNPRRCPVARCPRRENPGPEPPADRQTIS